MANLANIMIRRSMSSGPKGINHVTVVGGGLMGSGIAQVKIVGFSRTKSNIKLFFV